MVSSFGPSGWLVAFLEVSKGIPGSFSPGKPFPYFILYATQAEGVAFPLLVVSCQAVRNFYRASFVEQVEQLREECMTVHADQRAPASSEQVCALWLSDIPSLVLPPVERLREFLKERGGPVFLPLQPDTLAALRKSAEWDQLQLNVTDASSMMGAADVMNATTAALNAHACIRGNSESWVTMMTQGIVADILLVRAAPVQNLLLCLSSWFVCSRDRSSRRLI